jgi:hypothetical protein
LHVGKIGFTVIYRRRKLKKIVNFLAPFRIIVGNAYNN